MPPRASLSYSLALVIAVYRLLAEQARQGAGRPRAARAARSCSIVTGTPEREPLAHLGLVLNATAISEPITIGMTATMSHTGDVLRFLKIR